MKIGIPVYDGVDMLDVAGPFEMFDWADFDVEIVAAKPGMKRFRNRGFRSRSQNPSRNAPSMMPSGFPAAIQTRSPRSSTIRTGPTSNF